MSLTNILFGLSLQISNRVLYVFFTHVQEFFGNVTLKQVTKPLRWSNMATMPALPETQESIKEEIRRQVGIYFTVFMFTFALTSVPSVVNSHKLVTYSNSINHNRPVNGHHWTETDDIPAHFMCGKCLWSCDDYNCAFHGLLCCGLQYFYCGRKVRRTCLKAWIL